MASTGRSPWSLQLVCSLLLRLLAKGDHVTCIRQWCKCKCSYKCLFVCVCVCVQVFVCVCRVGQRGLNWSAPHPVEFPVRLFCPALPPL